MRTEPMLALCLLVFPITASAQADPQPYAGLEQREIKALSAEQIEAYLRGDGMGFAQAAELNHYPGPRHVIELAEQLELTPEQLAESQAVFNRMSAQAKELGRRLVEREAALDTLFAAGTADSMTVRAQVEKIASLQGALRFTHLAAHLEMKRVLTPHQVVVYDGLRGYGSGAAHQHHGSRP